MGVIRIKFKKKEITKQKLIDLGITTKIKSVGIIRDNEIFIDFEESPSDIELDIIEKYINGPLWIRITDKNLSNKEIDSYYLK